MLSHKPWALLRPLLPLLQMVVERLRLHGPCGCVLSCPCLLSYSLALQESLMTVAFDSRTEAVLGLGDRAFTAISS
jgi:hypothetical protein